MEDPKPVSVDSAPGEGTLTGAVPPQTPTIPEDYRREIIDLLWPIRKTYGLSASKDVLREVTGYHNLYMIPINGLAEAAEKMREHMRTLFASNSYARLAEMYKDVRYEPALRQSDVMQVNRELAVQALRHLVNRLERGTVEYESGGLILQAQPGLQGEPARLCVTSDLVLREVL